MKINNSDIARTFTKLANEAYLDYNFQSAFMNFTIAIKNHPTAENYRGRAMASYSIWAYDQALVDINEAIRLNPDEKISYFARGLIFEKMEKKEQAVLDFDRAGVDPEDSSSADAYKQALNFVASKEVDGNA